MQEAWFIKNLQMRVVSMHEQVTEASWNTWEVTVRERERGLDQALEITKD